MNRPLLQKRIDELEAIFETDQADLETLRLLEGELAFRSVPRATTLLAKVKRVMASSTTSPSAAQRQLPDKKSAGVQDDLSKEPPKPGKPMPPEMVLEDALRILRVTSDASWEAVELSRRQAVDRAHPLKLRGLSAEKREILEQEARGANAAHRLLLRARQG